MTTTNTTPPPDDVVRSYIRVRYADTDQMGVVYHTNYLVWFEVGRTDYLRERGFAYRDLEAAGYFLPVVDVGVRFLQPARYDDEVVVESRLLRFNRLRVSFAYRAIDVCSGALLAEGETHHVFIDPQRRPRRLPPGNSLDESLRRAISRQSPG